MTQTPSVLWGQSWGGKWGRIMPPHTAEKRTQDGLSCTQSSSPHPPDQCTRDLHFPCSHASRGLLFLRGVIHLRLFDSYFISPKYILYEKINSNHLNPLTRAKRPVMGGGTVGRRPEGGAVCDGAALQGVLEQNSHQALGALSTESSSSF